MLDFELGELKKNWDKQSELDCMRLVDIIFRESAFESILSIRVLELPITFVGSSVWDRNK